MSWEPLQVDDDGKVLVFQVDADELPAWQVTQVLLDAQEYTFAR